LALVVVRRFRRRMKRRLECPSELLILHDAIDQLLDGPTPLSGQRVSELPYSTLSATVNTIEIFLELGDSLRRNEPYGQHCLRPETSAERIFVVVVRHERSFLGS
jgi:hypothetical protein